MSVVIQKLIEYSYKLKQAGYLDQARDVGLLTSRIMINAKTIRNDVIPAKKLQEGMIVAGVGKRIGIGNFGNYGEIKYIHKKGKSIAISVYAPLTDDNFELLLRPTDSVHTLSLDKPMQRKALMYKAKLLLDDLTDKLKNHTYGYRLALLNSKLKEITEGK